MKTACRSAPSRQAHRRIDDGERRADIRIGILQEEHPNFVDRRWQLLSPHERPDRVELLVGDVQELYREPIDARIEIGILRLREGRVRLEIGEHVRENLSPSSYCFRFDAKSTCKSSLRGGSKTTSFPFT